MRRESHVRFSEGVGVRFPGATQRNVYVRSRRAGVDLQKVGTPAARVLQKDSPLGPEGFAEAFPPPSA